MVALFTATPLDISSILASPQVGAVLHLGQPSVTVLGAAPLLFGDISPAGRMVQTVYPSSYQNQISIFDFGMRPGPSPFARPDCTDQNVTACAKGTNPGRTYRFYTGKAVVPFGFGLSYSAFKYSQLASSVESAPLTIDLAPLRSLIDEADATGNPFVRSEAAEFARLKAGWKDRLDTTFRVNVTNTGSMDADDVVLGFLTPPRAGEDGVALKTLFGFERVHVPAGKTVSVFLYPALTDFASASSSGKLTAVPGNYGVSFGVKETLMDGGGYLRAGIVHAI